MDETSPQSDADADNIPMYSRVTDEYVFTAPGTELLSTWSTGMFGGSFGGSGSGNNGGMGGGPGAGGHDGEEGMGPLHPFSAHLQTWLPMAIALSVALPPSALFKLVGQAIQMLSGNTQQQAPAACVMVQLGNHVGAQGHRWAADRLVTSGTSQDRQSLEHLVHETAYSMGHLMSMALAWVNTAQVKSASFPPCSSTQAQGDSNGASNPLLDAVKKLSALGTSPEEVASAIIALEQRCAQVTAAYGLPWSICDVVSSVWSRWEAWMHAIQIAS
jgi:hypothetical protein